MTTSPEGEIAGVYRRRNASHVLELLAPARELGWQTAWWALDGADPLLEDVTVGEGPGEKLPLVNLALQSLALSAPWTVVSDDDLRFRRGDVVGFVRYCRRAGLDLAQPARARGTELSHAITIQARFSRARLTSFVESGPLFAVESGWRDRVLPLPEKRGMGWGIELEWLDLFERGCRLGIVDATVMEHLGTTGEHYDMSELHRRVDAELAERRLDWSFVRTVGTWRPWQRRPRWLRA